MYIGLDIQLHGRPDTSDPDDMAQEVKRKLIEWLSPKYDDDIQVDVSETAGWGE